jgi:hypothetical protein
MSKCDLCKFHVLCFELESKELRVNCPCGECIVKNICSQICETFNVHYISHKTKNENLDPQHALTLVKNALGRHRLLRISIFK